MPRVDHENTFHVSKKIEFIAPHRFTVSRFPLEGVVDFAFHPSEFSRAQRHIITAVRQTIRATRTSRSQKKDRNRKTICGPHESATCLVSTISQRLPSPSRQSSLRNTQTAAKCNRSVFFSILVTKPHTASFSR